MVIKLDELKEDMLVEGFFDREKYEAIVYKINYSKMLAYLKRKDDIEGSGIYVRNYGNTWKICFFNGCWRANGKYGSLKKVPCISDFKKRLYNEIRKR